MGSDAEYRALCAGASRSRNAALHVPRDNVKSVHGRHTDTECAAASGRRGSAAAQPEVGRAPQPDLRGRPRLALEAGDGRPARHDRPGDPAALRLLRREHLPARPGSAGVRPRRALRRLQGRRASRAIGRNSASASSGGSPSTGETVLANDVRKDPRYIVAFPGEAELLSELAVPIRLHGKTLGVINVEKREVNAFDDSRRDGDGDALRPARAGHRQRAALRADAPAPRPEPQHPGRGPFELVRARRRRCASSSRTRASAASSAAQRGGSARDGHPPARAGLALPARRRSSRRFSRRRRGEPSRCSAPTCRDPGPPNQPQRFFNVHVASAQMPEGGGVLLLFEDITERRRAGRGTAPREAETRARRGPHRRGTGAHRQGPPRSSGPTARSANGSAGAPPSSGRHCHEVYCRRDTKLRRPARPSSVSPPASTARRKSP